MKTLVYNYKDSKSEYKAEKVIKLNNKITGYIGTNVVFEFMGISDFTQFSLTDEDNNVVEYDTDDSNTQTQIMTDLVSQNATLQEQLRTLSITVAQLMLGGGTSA